MSDKMTNNDIPSEYPGTTSKETQEPTSSAKFNRMWRFAKYLVGGRLGGNDVPQLMSSLKYWATGIRHRKFGQKLSHHVMRKVLVLKVPGRHVM